MVEEVITTAKAYLTDSSKVVVIPRKLRKKLGENKTDLFIVKLDYKDRIIYEPIEKQPKQREQRELEPER